MSKAYYNIVEPLLEYTQNKLGVSFIKNEPHIRLLVEIIRQGMSDLHGSGVRAKADAARYFDGELFRTHCEYLAIPVEIMLQIVNNPDKHNKDYRADDPNDEEEYYNDL